jgi:peroxiredoxin
MSGMPDRKDAGNRRLLWILLLGAALAGPLAWWLAPGRHAAPDVTFTPLSTGPTSLAALRGRPVLVSFWATTCRPCVEELPDLRRLYEQYSPSGFELVAVAMPYDPPLYVQQFVKERGLPWPVVLDVDGAVARAFGVAYAPSAFLVDPEGRIVYQQIGKLDTERTRRMIENMPSIAPSSTEQK